MIEVVTRGHTLTHYTTHLQQLLLAATTVHCHDHRLIGTKTDSARVQYGIDGVTGCRWFVAISSSRRGTTNLHTLAASHMRRRLQLVLSATKRSRPGQSVKNLLPERMRVARSRVYEITFYSSRLLCVN